MGKLRKLSGRRVLRGFGYFFFFLVMTFVFTYLTLPFEQIKARYVKVAEDKYGVDIIGKIDKSWFTGLAVKNLRITPRGKPGMSWLYEPKGPAFEAADRAYRRAWGRPLLQIGVGGTIPFVALFGRRFGDREGLPEPITGVDVVRDH